VKKSARDETSCPLTLNTKGHYPGVVAIVGMPLILLSYDHGRLAHDDTPYPFLGECYFLYLYLIIIPFFSFFLGFIKGVSSTL
jgi:hypothetical protein